MNFVDFLRNSIFCKAKSLIQKILGEEGVFLCILFFAFVGLMEKFSVFLNITKNSDVTIFNQSINQPTQKGRKFLVNFKFLQSYVCIVILILFYSTICKELKITFIFEKWCYRNLLIMFNESTVNSTQ